MILVSSFTGAIKSIVAEATDLYGASTSFQLVWNGKVFKCLTISIDIVPCFVFSDWPAKAKNNGLVSNAVKLLGHHWLPFSGGKPRISFSLAEKYILKTLPQDIFKSYIYAKIMRNPSVCPKIKYTGRNLKEACYDPASLIPSIVLKNFLFQLSEGKDMNSKCKPSSAKLVYDIYKKVQQHFNDNEIPSFFLPAKRINFGIISETDKRKHIYEVVLGHILAYLQEDIIP